MVVIGTEPERTRPFYPNDNEIPLDSVDWKTRYNELKNRQDWDPVRDFVGIKRLGNSYHPIDPFFKFVGVAPENLTYDKLLLPSVCGSLGLVVGIISNYWARRPLVSGAVPTLFTTAVCAGIGWFAYTNSRRRAAERDAVLIHYMIIHENDFPRIERKKFGEIIKPWYPFRVGNDGLFLKD